jgi:hypothetical protein
MIGMSIAQEATATVQTHHLLFPEALGMAEVQALAKLDPSLHDRLSAAMWLVQHGHLHQLDDGSWQVTSQTNPYEVYRVNGHCSCPDAHYQAPQGLCKHRLSVCLHRRALQLMHDSASAGSEAPATPAPADNPAPHEHVEHTHRVPAQYIVMIQNKPFVRFAGLLALAHERGLQSLRTVFTFNDAALSLAECTAVFPFGTFTDVGDASPDNTNQKVRAHFRRVAATRATARALRQALNINMVAVEELLTEE